MARFSLDKLYYPGGIIPRDPPEHSDKCEKMRDRKGFFRDHEGPCDCSYQAKRAAMRPTLDQVVNHPLWQDSDVQELADRYVITHRTRRASATLLKRPA